MAGTGYLPHARAQYNLGAAYANGEGVPQDHAKAVRWFRKAAVQGNANAQFELGQMQAVGKGLAQVDAEIAAWFKKAITALVILAAFLIGCLGLLKLVGRRRATNEVTR